MKDFGTKYLNKFDNSINRKEAAYLITHRKSMKASYGNLITCRHEFVHQGNPTLTVTEVIDNYYLGKEVIHSLFDSMKR